MMNDSHNTNDFECGEDYWEVGLVTCHYNYTRKLSGRYGTYDLPLEIFMISCCCVIWVFNIAVLLIRRKHEKHGYRISLLLNSLLILDIWAGVVVMCCMNLILGGDITLGLTGYGLLAREGAIVMIFIGQMFHVLFITMERLTTIRQFEPPVDDPWVQASSFRRQWMEIGTCWGVAALWGSLPLMGWNCIGRLPKCSNAFPLFSESYTLASVVLGIIGFGLVFSWYLLIIVQVKKRDPDGRHSFKVGKTVACILTLWVVSWGPIMTIILVDNWCGPRECRVINRLTYFFVLTMLSAVANPLLYGITWTEVKNSRICNSCKHGGRQRGKYLFPPRAGLRSGVHGDLKHVTLSATQL